MLILATDRETTKRLAVPLTDRGILLFTCPLETAQFLCDKKDTGGVIVDCLPCHSVGAALCASLRRLYPNLPIAAIASAPILACNRILPESSDEDERIAEAECFARELCGVPSALSTYALTADPATRAVQYLGYLIKLSPTEFRLLYCLFYRSPRPTTADDLLSLCYHNGPRTVSNVTVQIHRINQKAVRIDPRPLIVCTTDGYRLRDGIL